MREHTCMMSHEARGNSVSCNGRCLQEVELEQYFRTLKLWCECFVYSFFFGHTIGFLNAFISLAQETWEILIFEYIGNRDA